MADDPIPDNLVQAFGAAVEHFERDWSPDMPDQPLVRVGVKARSIREVCDLVADFDDRLPENVHADLWAQIHMGSEDLKAELSESQTYATAARCLRELVDRKVAAYQQKHHP
jgi:hypothetical protein